MIDIKMNRTYCSDHGRWSRDVFGSEELWDVNYSSILTKLIQEAGRYCRHYASDLFISWSCIEKELHNREYAGGTYYFGFRDMGVDHNAFVEHRLCSEVYDNFRYEALWILEIVVDGDEITMTLGECTDPGIVKKYPDDRHEDIRYIAELAEKTVTGAPGEDECGKAENEIYAELANIVNEYTDFEAEVKQDEP